jgi:cell fate regulator YaaT (PSP1 superfamily)
MKIIEVQFTPWGRIYDFDAGETNFSVGDFVVVKTDLGVEMGKVVGTKELEVKEVEAAKVGIKPIFRKANTADTIKFKEKEDQKKEALAVCRQLVKKYKLPIKLIDAHFSFDGGRLTFAFVADGRVDFRELVKDLTKTFQKSIRLQQLGIRDEAKISGDVGACGRNLCCRKFKKDLGNISSELADLQQIAHRGSDRLAGVCGRLMCCLAYEQKTYEEAVKKLPPVGTKVRTDRGRGQVIGWHVLKQSVEVKLDEGTIIEVQIKK